MKTDDFDAAAEQLVRARHVLSEHIIYCDSCSRPRRLCSAGRVLCERVISLEIDVFVGGN